MAMPADHEERLLRRLRRLMASVEAADGPDQRRLLLVMQDEVRTIRAELIRHSRTLAEQIDAAGIQFGAANAYARCAKLQRNIPQALNKAMD
jgi:hypothetical protein